MVLYEVDINVILVQEIQNWILDKMVAAYNILVAQLKKTGFEPKLHLLDNKCLQEYKEVMTSNKMKCQLVPPNDHRRIIVEKAIQTFKDLFVTLSFGSDS